LLVAPPEVNIFSFGFSDTQNSTKRPKICTLAANKASTEGRGQHALDVIVTNSRLEGGRERAASYLWRENEQVREGEEKHFNADEKVLHNAIWLTVFAEPNSFFRAKSCCA
jgi:hypothetical protein